MVNPVTSINQVNGEMVRVVLNGNDLVVELNQKKKSQIIIYDLNGRIIFENEINNGFLRMNLAVLSKGKYLYSVISGNEVLKDGTFSRF